MTLKTIQFAAVLYAEKKSGWKLNKKTGRHPKDMEFEKGKMMAPLSKEICHCFLNDKAFLAIGFHKQYSHGIGIVPGVGIPITKRMESGEAHVGFMLDEITNYKRMQSILDGKRVVINSINFIVHIRPVTDKTLDQPFANRKMIKKVHEQYENLGIRSAGGSGYMAKYDEPFLTWLMGAFDYLTQNGYIQRKPDFQLAVCKKHKTSGEYISEYNAFFCEKCGNYI